MKKIKIAQIGTSEFSHGNLIWNSIKKQSGIFEIVGYAMPENENEKFKFQMKDFEGYRQMTVEEIMRNPEIEAVIIETEEIYLTKYALMAAKHRKHIHMEKPGGTDLNEFEELIKTVKENNTVFSIGYMYRYNPYIRESIQQVKDGKLGEIISVEAQMSCIEPQKLREWLKTFKGGMMFFLGCHLIDLILQISGKPERIIPFNRSTNIDNVTSEDYGMAILEYKNGTSFVKTSAYEIGGFERRQFVITGSKGSIELKPLEWYEDGLIKTRKVERYSSDWHESGAVSWSEGFDRYDDMLSKFAAYVRKEEENPYSPDYESELYKTLLLCCGIKNI